MTEFPSLPPGFRTQKEYDEWIDEHAEHEADEFGSYYDGETVIPENVDVWVHDSPNPDGAWMDWVRLYDDVNRLGHTPIPDRTLDLPGNDVITCIGQAVAYAVRNDISRETLGHVRDDDRVVLDE